MRTRGVPPPAGSARRPVAALLGAAALALAATAGCSRGGGADDPALRALGRVLRSGDRLVLVRALDPDTLNSFVTVVRPAAGKPELRIYERQGEQADYVLARRIQQGDLFHNLSLEDVTGDGRDEIVVTWTGGQLEMLDVITRADDGTYRDLFQNAGQQIERRFGAAGVVEFWITSRTYEERAGQPPAYAVTVYRWDGKGFEEVSRR